VPTRNFDLHSHSDQFNFYDHSKLILSSQGLVVTHIDKQYRLTHWTLSDLMRRALLPPPSDPEAAKFEQKLIDKLKYARDVLHSIINAQEKGLPASEENATGAC
jgi:cell cycle serine/threonine-protein kinase CDC5/MSD2